MVKTAASFFETVEKAPDDAILILPILFEKDSHPHKVNLGIGSYKTAEGKPYLFDAVVTAEERLAVSKQNKDYLPIDGDRRFLNEGLKLVFGSKIEDERLFACQTVGGTGALKLAANFLKHITDNLWLSDPSWPNHEPIFSSANLHVQRYPYYDHKRHRVNFEGLCHCIEKMPERSAIVLQPSCHNPSGEDLTFDQWKELSNLIHNKNLIPLFDMAYQGFGSSVDEDAKPIRYFYSEGHEMLLTVSFAKNFGLYSERVGLLALVTHNSKEALNCGSQIKQNIRTIYSTPPSHGAKVVAEILSQSELKRAWLEELGNTKIRIDAMREAFSSGLEAKGSTIDFLYLMRQKGFFSLLDLNEGQVLKLREEKGIFMPLNGRINIAGLNPYNMDYVIDSIIWITEKTR